MIFQSHVSFPRHEIKEGFVPKEQEVMFRLLKILFYLAILSGLGLVGYALFFDLPAPTTEVTLPIEPNLD